MILDYSAHSRIMQTEATSYSLYGMSSTLVNAIELAHTFRQIRVACFNQQILRGVPSNSRRL